MEIIRKRIFARAGLLGNPSDGYHGIRFYETFGDFGFTMKARCETLRTLGHAMSPFNAFMMLQGLETLPLRMDRHVANTREVVAFLADQPLVESVSYPELAGHPDHALAQQILPNGVGAVFSFELAGGRSAGRAFIESLELFSHLANVGDAKSLVIHPASTTHHRMDAKALAAAGIGEGLIRLSVGLEDPADLIGDLKKGLKAVERLVGASAKGSAGGKS